MEQKTEILLWERLFAAIWIAIFTASTISTT